MIFLSLGVLLDFPVLIFLNPSLDSEKAGSHFPPYVDLFAQSANCLLLTWPLQLRLLPAASVPGPGHQGLCCTRHLPSPLLPQASPCWEGSKGRQKRTG